jgi:hypothetical protein
LFNFDIGGDRLKVEHQGAIADHVLRALRFAGSVSIFGFASRSDSPEVNTPLSERRARNTLAFMQGKLPRPFNSHVRAWGENWARYEGQPDRSEDPRYRSVVIYYHHDDTPDPPREVPDFGVTVPGSLEVPDMPVLDSLGAILEAISALGELSIFVTGSLAVFLEGAGLVTGVVGTALSLPAGWLSADRCARFNGACEGFWEAMQFMANRFSSSRLQETPLARWPRIPDPPRRRINVEVAVDREFNEGLREGRDLAWDHIRRLQRRPQRRQVTIDGRRTTVEVSGRVFLALMWRQHGDPGLKRELRRQVDERLRRRGLPPYPLRDLGL